MAFLTKLSSIISIPADLELEIRSISHELSIAKNSVLINSGERCNDLFFVEEGLLRGFYFEDGKEITNWFAPENEFATCFYSFIARQPSFETIQAMEDSRLIRVSNSDLEKIYLKFPEAERIGRIITEMYYIKLEERLADLRFKTAKERYEKLAESKPGLLQRVTLGQIASYLGISQETLSRIRQ